MQEVCCRYCRRRAEVDDREPMWGEGGSEALKCPQCGHLDLLSLFNADARWVVFEAAVRRWLETLEERVQPRPEPTEIA
jgi:hypothetical protein